MTRAIHLLFAAEYRDHGFGSRPHQGPDAGFGTALPDVPPRQPFGFRQGVMILTPVVVPSRMGHLFLGEERGTVYFACESQPLLTLRNFGPPTHCPLCKTENPTGRPVAVQSEGEP